MSTQTHERSILTVGTFTVTDAVGQESNVYREPALIETHEGGWLIRVGEPDATDDPEGELVFSGMIRVPDDAASAFDELFALIADPATVKA